MSSVEFTSQYTFLGLWPKKEKMREMIIKSIQQYLCLFLPFLLVANQTSIPTTKLCPLDAIGTCFTSQENTEKY